MLLHIGIDDTDSPRGGCTTYIAALLVERVLSLGGKFVDYPNLLRLNPNVPWKTRGNGAVCLRFSIEPSIVSVLKRSTIELVESLSDLECENTNPGIVFLKGEIPESISEFSERVVKRVVTLESAMGLVDEFKAHATGFKKMRGIIGALAAVGGLQEGDHTYEFLAYRTPERRGTPREVDPVSVERMDEASGGSTFNNIDPETGRVLIAPGGPDPVLIGVRGEDPESVREAGLMVASEPVERWVLFRANQGTDAHLGEPVTMDRLNRNAPGVVEGEVATTPETIRGGHVFFVLADHKGRVNCAAYEPTGAFRDVVRGLTVGDRVSAFGGVREGKRSDRLTLNLEKMEVLKLVPDLRLVNPGCPDCGGRMESMGRGKGFRCRRCGFRGREMEKKEVERERLLEPGLHIPPPRAQRHLTKPKGRYGKEKRGTPRIELIEPWHWP